MRRPRFYTEQPLAQGAAIALTPDPSRHIAKALRMQRGDELCLFDGCGHEAQAVIADLARDAVTVTLVDVRDIDRESPLDVTLVVALSRGYRMETVIQKATELGVSEIRPVVTERTGVRLDSTRLEKKRQHWQRVAASACEQCGRNRLPRLAAPAPLGGFLAEARPDPASLRLILHPFDTARERPGTSPPADGGIAGAPAGVVLLVGPEGGFSEQEVDGAVASGFRPLVLGPRVLRTETAPLAALSVIQARWGDLGAGVCGLAGVQAGSGES